MPPPSPATGGLFDRRSATFTGLISDESKTARWFAEEVLPHEPKLRAWLRAKFSTLRDIDDLVQDTYTRMLGAHPATSISSVKAFLFATARNLAIDRIRRRQVVAIDYIAEIEPLIVFEDKADVREMVSLRQELDLLTQAIQTLPDRCRKVLTLRKIYSLSQKEIAAQLGISEHTVEVQVANGMHRCAEFLSRHGVP